MPGAYGYDPLLALQFSGIGGLGADNPVRRKREAGGLGGGSTATATQNRDRELAERQRNNSGARAYGKGPAYVKAVPGLDALFGMSRMMR